MVVQRLEGGGMESYYLMRTEFLFYKIKGVMEMDGGDDYTTL
jgi:hypothetical protein